MKIKKIEDVLMVIDDHGFWEDFEIWFNENMEFIDKQIPDCKSNFGSILTEEDITFMLGLKTFGYENGIDLTMLVTVIGMIKQRLNLLERHKSIA